MLPKAKCDHLHHVCADGLAPWWWRWSRRAFSLFTAYQILSVDFYFQWALHTAITDAVYCVKLVVSDRRVANKLRKGLDKSLHKSYNTTPAEGKTRSSSLLFAAWFFWPHIYHLIFHTWPHVVAKVFLLWSLFISSLPAEQIPSASTTPKTRPHINHSVLGFDHIFDHKQIRSTRRQDVTRVWKSRFCVAERSKKSKNG